MQPNAGARAGSDARKTWVRLLEAMGKRDEKDYEPRISEFYSSLACDDLQYLSTIAERSLYFNAPAYGDYSYAPVRPSVNAAKFEDPNIAAQVATILEEYRSRPGKPKDEDYGFSYYDTSFYPGGRGNPALILKTLETSDCKARKASETEWNRSLADLKSAAELREQRRKAEEEKKAKAEREKAGQNGPSKPAAKQ